MCTSSTSSSKRRNSRQAGQHGVALIEALVGMLIFAFGVLGLIGLQASMTKAQTGAKFRADAVNLSSELLGVMWSDTAVNLTKYRTAGCGGYARCADWLGKLQAQLPASDVQIAVDAATGNVDITITWTQPGEGQHRYQTTAVVQP